MGVQGRLGIRLLAAVTATVAIGAWGVASAAQGSSSERAAATPLYKDASRPTEQRIEDLESRR